MIPNPPKPERPTSQESGRPITAPIDFGTAFRPQRGSAGASLHFWGFTAGLAVTAIFVGSVLAQLRISFVIIALMAVFVVLLLTWWRNGWRHFCEEWLLADLPLRPVTRTVWPRSSRLWRDIFHAMRRLPLLITDRQSSTTKETAVVESAAILAMLLLYSVITPKIIPADAACLLLAVLCIASCLTLAQSRSPSQFRRFGYFFYRLRRLWFTYPDRHDTQLALWTSPYALLRRQGSYVAAIGALYLFMSTAFVGPSVVLPKGALLLIAPLLAELVLFTYLLPDLLQLGALGFELTKQDRDTRCPWEQLIDRKRGSADRDERQRLLWGLDAATMEPVLIDRRILADHAHVRGATGSGKTSGALIPLALQLLDEQQEGSQASSRKRDPLIVLDLGGDQAMFHAVRQAAERNGRRFRFFSVQTGHASDYFDPLQSLLSDQIRDPQLASMFVEAFNLDYGLRYGAQYFTEQNLSSFLAVLRHYRQREDRRPTLESLYQFLRDNHQRAEFRNAEQILMCIGFLLDYPQLNARQTDPAASDHIYMPRVLEESEVVYFYLPTLNEAAFVREIAGLALYSLLAAAMDRTGSGRNSSEPRQAWILVDEFQELAGSSFANLLAQSRKFGLGLVLANQSTVQLKNRDVNLADLVEENTAVRQYFTVTADEVKHLQTLSGEEDHLRTTFRGGDFPASQVWMKEPSLELNAILEASGHRQECFLIVRDGQGAAKPRRVVSMYPMTFEEYERLRHLPLPRRPAPEPEPAHATTGNSPPADVATVDPQNAKRRERLAALWEKYQAELRVERSGSRSASPGTRFKPKKTKDP